MLPLKSSCKCSVFFALVLISLLLPTKKAYSQLLIEDNLSMESLIQQLAAEGVYVYNITYHCPYQGKPSFGSFSDPSETFGASKGIILTTGAAKNAIGPNTMSGMSQSNGYISNDPNLQSLIDPGKELFDHCIVEFDIISHTDTLRFNYLFGSEEYPEYIINYHDVFGFFISGPGISGIKNIALVPGTNLPVSIKNINHLTNSTYYIENNFPNSLTQYDGYTKLLQAKIKVTPCEIYHIKLAIADVLDDIYDTGVFISNKTLRGKNISLELKLDNPDLKTMIEGCNRAKLVFKRTHDIDKPFTGRYTISGTAVNGVDYQKIPTEVNFLPGQSEVIINLIGLEDNILESEETITFNLENLCPNMPLLPAQTIKLRDVFDHTITPLATCKENTVILNTNTPTGYSFVWEKNPALSCTTCTSPTVQTTQTQTFKTQVTHLASGCTTFTSVQVTVFPSPDISFTYSRDPKYMNGDILFKLNNEATLTDVAWDLGDGTTSTEKNPKHTYITEDLSQEKKTYTVKVSGYDITNHCFKSDSGIVEITPLFIPNIITPNEDGINDLFRIDGIEPGTWKLEVYNRFGQLVYFSDFYDMNWDGGKLSDGIYYYSLSNYYRDRTFKGWVQILRDYPAESKNE